MKQRDDSVVRVGSLVAIALSASLVLTVAPVLAQEWPQDDEWWPLLIDGEPAGDVCDDAQGPRDIVGTTEHPVVQLYFSYPELGSPAEYFFVRMRIDEDPSCCWVLLVDP